MTMITILHVAAPRYAAADRRTEAQCVCVGVCVCVCVCVCDSRNGSPLTNDPTARPQHRKQLGRVD